MSLQKKTKRDQREYWAKYQAENREELNIKARKRYQENKERYKLTRSSPARKKSDKAYYQRNRDKILAWAKNNYHENKVMIKAKREAKKGKSTPAIDAKTDKLND